MTTEYDTTKLIASAATAHGAPLQPEHQDFDLRHRLAEFLALNDPHSNGNDCFQVVRDYVALDDWAKDGEYPGNEIEDCNNWLRMVDLVIASGWHPAALPREVTWPTPEQSETDPRYEEATIDALEKVWRVEETNPGTNWMSTETKVRLGIDFYNAACRILFAPSVTPGGEEQGDES